MALAETNRAESTTDTASQPSSPLRSSLGVCEFTLASLALMILGVLVYASHVRHGGFYLDDWPNAAGARYPPGGPGFGKVISYFDGLFAFRPVLILYMSVIYSVLGTHFAYQLAFTVVLAVLLAAVLYGLLRTLGLARIHAWLIAGLSTVYPWFDSVRFWTAANLLTLSLIFACVGLWLAVVGLANHSWRLHVCAAFLYLLSILTYEITLPLIALAGLLYTSRAGFRASRARWAVDLLVVLAGGLWVGLHTPRETRGLSADVTHMGNMIVSGGTILGRSVIPLGAQRTTLALVVFAVVIVGGILVRVIFSQRFTAPKSELSMWLWLSGAGLAVAILGWMIFIPANPYYTPSIYGFTNRVNGLAGFGLVIAVYGALGVVASFAGQLRPRNRIWTTSVHIGLAILLGIAYVHVLERHSGIWNTAYSAESAAIGEMRTQFPHLPSGTTVFASNYPDYQTLGVPIFSAQWDINGMIKLQYKDGSLSAYSVLPGLSPVCRTNGIELQGAEAPTITAPYGTARLLDLQTGRHSQPRNERECQAEASTYTPGPLYLSLNY